MAQDQALPDAPMYRTAHQVAAAHLRSAILGGRLTPGAAISPDEVADELHVSRMPVREALRELATEGLVELRPHRQALVVSLEDVDIAEIFGIRALLESRAVELAVPHVDEPALKGLRWCASQMEAALHSEEPEKWLALNRQFHSAIDARCPWSRLRSLIEVQHNALAPYFRMWGSDRATSTLISCMPKFHEEHRAILHAIELSDARAAAKAASDHVLSSCEELLAVLSSLRSPVAEL